MEKLELIDILSEDDLLIASHLDDSLQDFRVSVMLENIDENEDLKLIRTMSSQEAENAAVPKQRGQNLLVSESKDPGIACPFRKSLAWDSAFFTSAGVLDPEELCNVNPGYKKSEAHLVRKIQQDQRKRRSVDIEYTLDSDGFCFETNESIKGDLLFEDVTAIQRSSIMLKSGCKSGIGEARKQKSCSLKKQDDVSRNRVKSMPISRRQSIYMQGSERTKEFVAHPQTVQHAARNGEPNLVFRKPPKILRMMNPVSAGQTKILSSADPIKMEKKTATSGYMSKRTGFGTSCSSTSSMVSPRSSSSLTVTASNDSTASCSPSFKFSSSLRRKADSKKTRLAVAGSTSKTPLRCSLGSKTDLENRGLSNSCSYSSPISSADGWPSELSSTSAKHRSNCLETSFGTNKSRVACLHNVATQQLHLQSHSDNQLFGHQESQQTKLLNQGIDEVAGNGNASAESRRNLRPSGLRMPSPKIGFFDEEKSPVLSVSGGLQLHFGAQSLLSNTNGETFDKPQAVSVLPEKGNIKSCSEQTGEIMARYAAQSQKQEESSQKVSSILATLRNCPGKASKFQSSVSSQVRRENFSKFRAVSDGGYDTRKLGLNYSLKEERKRTEEILKNEMRRDSKRLVRLRGTTIHPSKDEPPVHTKGLNQSKNENRRTRGRHHLENSPHALHKNEKENLSSLEDRVNGLSRYFEAIDLSRDTVIDLNGKKKGRCNTIFGNNFNGMETMAAYFIPSTRTPLADRNSVCTGAESFGFTTG